MKSEVRKAVRVLWDRQSFIKYAILCGATGLLASSACTTRHTEVTVTTRSRPPAHPRTFEAQMVSTTPPAAQAQSFPVLPEHDANIERAGDRVAAAIIHLRGRHNAEALRALTEARSIMAQRINNVAGVPGDPLGQQLRSALSDMESAGRMIQRGDFAAGGAQLIRVNDELDRLDFVTSTRR